MENNYRLKEIIISVTNHCNLRCIMCEIPQINNNEEMTTEELKDLISDAVNLCPNSIVFSGGEPLLRKDIFELISFANCYKINTCLTSNGVLINGSIAKKLSLSGIGVVNISIDGPENIHNLLRGRGTFRGAIRALEHLSRYKIEITIATIVCRQNYKTLSYVMDLAHQSGVTTVKFQPFSEIFLIKKDKGKEFFVSETALEDIRLSMEKAIEFSKRYRIATNPINYLYNIPFYLCGLRQNYTHNSCPSLWSSCPISAEGNVYPCWRLSGRLLGNIKKTRLSQLWNSIEHNRLRNLIVQGGCPGCLMSCYDYNFGKDDLRQTISFKVSKFKKPKFYKRQYYRIYQYVRYILRKILNRIVNLNLFYKSDKYKPNEILNEIKTVEDMLKKEFRILDKDE